MTRKTGQRRLLVVDWDSFFRNPLGAPAQTWAFPHEWSLYDWGHNESQFYIETVWPGRASVFLRLGHPLPGTTGEEVGFWDRFRLAPGATLFYGDSNAQAVSLDVFGRRFPITWEEVWLYDAHHDTGYTGGPSECEARKLVQRGAWHCDDWMVLYDAVGAELHVRYPRWKPWAMEAEPEPLVEVDRQVDDGASPPVTFDRVFVCRSGAWVPPWADMDRRFLAFVDAAPVKRRVCLEPAGRSSLVRDWNDRWAQDLATQMRDLMAPAAEKHPVGGRR